MRFANPPLIECIVELRWNYDAAGAGGPGLAQMPIVFSGHQEEFFMRFGAKVSQLGFERLERLVPPGFPVMHQQPVYRFRSGADGKKSCLYQVGPGVFSANITPPYTSWDDFVVIARDGIEKLMESRDPGEREQPFTSCLVRYIDAFKPDLTGGRGVASFLREVMGVEVRLPESVQDSVRQGSEVEPTLQLKLPLRGGQTMSLGFQAGNIEGANCVVMDTIVATDTPVEATTEAVMASLEQAHAEIRRVFIELTQRIRGEMRPDGAPA